MNAEPKGPARLLADVLATPDVDAWRERLRRECLERLGAVPTGRALLLRDVVEDAHHLAFQRRLRAAVGARLAGTPPWRRWVPWAAALLIVLFGAGLARRDAAPTDREPVAADPVPTNAPRWVVRTRPLAPAALTRARLAFADRAGGRLGVVGTRPLAARLRLAPEGVPRGWAISPPMPLERLDDAGLLALLPGRPSAIVETAPGAKRLVLLDPADEAALVAPDPDEIPR